MHHGYHPVHPGINPAARKILLKLFKTHTQNMERILIHGDTILIIRRDLCPALFILCARQPATAVLGFQRIKVKRKKLLQLCKLQRVFLKIIARLLDIFLQVIRCKFRKKIPLLHIVTDLYMHIAHRPAYCAKTKRFLTRLLIGAVQVLNQLHILPRNLRQIILDLIHRLHQHHMPARFLRRQQTASAKHQWCGQQRRRIFFPYPLLFQLFPPFLTIILL